ncbi:hypothetical protein V2H21_01115 [Riemerella anatipestifer]|uniref:hypothetical protein n=1 Tax=Riemerella anatipestifer TaxID=34085 RepID=UPI002EB2A6FB|nr:hypothetical protein [Riemerella anatipestifer]
MTTQEKLKIITDNIRQKLPRLMELEEGCLICNKNTSKILKILHTIPYKKGENIETHYAIYNEKYLCLSIVLNVDNYTIIGKEPMLNDVLEWLQLLPNLLERNEDLFLYIEGIFCIYDSGWNKFNYTKVCWDLTKHYLKDQSKEVIDFLYNLIENEKTT